MHDLEGLWQALAPADAAAAPRRLRLADGVIADVADNGCVCWSVLSSDARPWRAPAGQALQASPWGGWLLQGTDPAEPCHWVPFLPRAVDLDAHRRVLALRPVAVSALSAEGGRLAIATGSGTPVEAVVWRLPAQAAAWPASALERGAWFTLGSHTTVQGRAQVYAHLVAGTVYENRVAYPNQWRVFSENDGHALHLILAGLARATGDPLLEALRQQVLLAVLDRQSEDGGFRHGEWTHLMESHFRLHCSAMHLMMDALAERPDARVAAALTRAADFLSRQSVELSFGRWLLHDELEHSLDSMRQSPLRWVSSTAFGKTESNMLVLNSHLDGIVALDRYAELTGDRRHDALVQSARGAARAVLALRSAEPLYRALFWLVDMTFLPVGRARALPVWKRALKRLTWQHLLPLMPAIKARFPRLVMPGGYIDRDLVQQHWALDYHAVNLMDLARYVRRFDEPEVRAVLEQALEFTHRSGILGRCIDLGYRQYAIGFWAEALYHMCLGGPQAHYRRWLAEAMLLLEDQRMGQAPSLLGANGEAVAPAEQLPCPSPADARLRVAQLGRRGQPELLVVNPAGEALPLAWERAPAEAPQWCDAEGRPLPREGLHVPPRGWLWGRAAH